MFRNIEIAFYIILSGFLFSSCEEPGSHKLGYSGGFGEMIVVAPNSIWETPLGDSIYNILGAYQYGFPQNERQFSVIHITPKKFKSVLRGHRNICVVKIDTSTVRPISLEKSKWSKGQLVITLSAKNRDRLLKTVQEHGPRAAELFQSAEINRHNLRNKSFGDAETNQQIEAVQNYSFVSQKDAHLEKNENGLSWIRLERERIKGGFRHQISQGIMLFSLPYTNTTNFLDTNVYATIDSVLKINLPGPGKNQYMQLNYRFVPPLGTEINYKNSFGKEYRGLWRMKNNSMGGPIYLLVFLDEKANRVIYAFGYVFAPQFNKREYLREIEGMINSITLKEG
jgi:hypothetical protein